MIVMDITPRRQQQNAETSVDRETKPEQTFPPGRPGNVDGPVKRLFNILKVNGETLKQMQCDRPYTHWDTPETLNPVRETGQKRRMKTRLDNRQCVCQILSTESCHVLCLQFEERAQTDLNVHRFGCTREVLSFCKRLDTMHMRICVHKTFSSSSINIRPPKNLTTPSLRNFLYFYLFTLSKAPM